MLFYVSNKYDKPYYSFVRANNHVHGFSTGVFFMNAERNRTLAEQCDSKNFRNNNQRTKYVLVCPD